MAANEPYPGTQAVLRALALLKTFDDARPEWSLLELAGAVGLNKTTTYRLLTALESEGLVTRRGEADAYRLGPEVIVLGGRAIRANNLRLVSRPALEKLAEQTGETATLEVMWQGQVLILGEVTGNHLVGATPYVGSQWPLHATATGKVLLAGLPAPARATVLKLPLTAQTPRTITSRDALEKALNRIREQGYALADQELELGYMSVAAPVHNHEGQVIAALSVGAPSARLVPQKVDEILTLVKAEAAEVSAQLGYEVGK